MNKLSVLSAFISGVVIGYASSWYFTKKKYEQIANEEIESVKERFSYKTSSEEHSKDGDKKNKNWKEGYDEETTDQEKPEISEYTKKLNTEGYTNYSTNEKSSKPYVISPEQFGENDEYDRISLTYYSDSVLADENDEIMDDTEDSVGSDFMNHFGEYEDDSVFVRNDRLKVDYEILLDSRPYYHVLKEKPYLGGI